jgi:hypothetical protein
MINPAHCPSHLAFKPSRQAFRIDDLTARSRNAIMPATILDGTMDMTGSQP